MSNIIQTEVEAAQRSTLAPMLHSVLDETAQDFLRENGIMRQFSDQQIIQHRGDSADGFWLIEEGSVTVGQFLPHGEFRSVARLGPGDSYGELAVLGGRPRVVDAISRGESRLLFIPTPAIEALLRASPQAARAMLGALSQQLQEVLDLVAGMRSGSSVARTAGLLANFARDGSGDVKLSVTQQEIADLLGLTRATANKALCKLEAQGLIQRQYGAITVRDVEGLRWLALK